MPADSAGLLRKDSVSTNPSVPKSQRNANFEEGDSCGVTGLDKGTDFLMILTGGTQALHSESSLISETSGTATPPSSVCLRASLRWEPCDRHLKEGQSLHPWLAPGDRSGRRPWYLPAFVVFYLLVCLGPHRLFLLTLTDTQLCSSSLPPSAQACLGEASWRPHG